MKNTWHFLKYNNTFGILLDEKLSLYKQIFVCSVTNQKKLNNGYSM